MDVLNLNRLYDCREQNSDLYPEFLHSFPGAGVDSFLFFVCGCRGSHSVTGSENAQFGTNTSCYIFRRGDYAVIVDCGTGLYQAGPVLIGCTKIDILLTHVHYDHVIGLLSRDMFPKGCQIRVYGEFMTWFGECSLDALFRPPFWPVSIPVGEMISTAPDGTEYTLCRDVSFIMHPADHPNHCSMIRLNLAGKVVCVLSDCERPDIISAQFLAGSDILLYDGMYNADEKRAHPNWGHSCWEDGCELANHLQPKQLIITHHNPDHTDSILLDYEHSAQQRFANTRFAREGDVWLL